MTRSTGRDAADQACSKRVPWISFRGGKGELARRDYIDSPKGSTSLWSKPEVEEEGRAYWGGDAALVRCWAGGDWRPCRSTRARSENNS